MKKIIFILTAFVFFVPYIFAEISVIPYGGAETTSGSCFLINVDGYEILADCGMFFGDREERYSDVEGIEKLVSAKALILTHAHLDHCGRIPLLVSKGFKGKIYSTLATKTLALSMFKSGNGFDIAQRRWFWSKSREANARFNDSYAVAHWDENCRKKIKEAESSKNPISLASLQKIVGVKFSVCKKCCTKETAEIEKLFETVKYEEIKNISDNIKIKLSDAGHVPGSSCVLVYAKNKKILFSGDLGSGYSRLNNMPTVPEKADIVFMEATYAGDKSEDGVEGYTTFRKDLSEALKEGKTIWIPALSFHRTQKVLYELRSMQKENILDISIPIYSVSPSANAITEIYQKELLNDEGEWFCDDIYREGSILPLNLKRSKKVNFNGQMILISSSGDMDKGMSARFVNTLLPRKDVSVMIVNYVSPQSTAALVLKGEKNAGETINNVSAKKYDVFSEHAGFETIKRWLSKQNKKTPIYLIHTEKENAKEMKKFLYKNGRQNVSSAVFMQKIVIDKK